MRTSIIPVLSIIAVLSACDHDQGTTPASPPMIVARSLSPGESARLEAALRRSEEVAELIRIRDELTSRARDRSVTPEMVRQAYTGADPTAAADLLGLSSSESGALDARLLTVQRSLYEKFPVLRSLADGEVTAGETCGAEAAARALTRLRPGRPTSGATPMNEEDIPVVDDGCKWLQYTAALAVCTTAGPVIYWPCAYIAYCSFCSDDLGICG
jgi:hypothetical protein